MATQLSVKSMTVVNIWSMTRRCSVVERSNENKYLGDLTRRPHSWVVSVESGALLCEP